MATRSDQLHSHQFAGQRLVAALALRNPDATPDGRRVGGAVIAGLLIGALALAAVGVYGVFRPSGGGSWREGGSVIIERETGARFVYLDGRLHPVANYSSALLILGQANPPSAQVPRSVLLGEPRGVPLGIAGAPDLLPAPADLVGAPWTLCSRPPAGAGASSAEAATAPASAPESVLYVGAIPAGLVELASDQGLLAQAADGSLHLVWRSRRHPIEAPELVLAALTWHDERPVPVAAEILNALPIGDSLGRVDVPRSEQTSAVPGLRIGEVFYVETSARTRQFGVALAGGLADITQVQADLLIADGANGPRGQATEIGLAQYASAPRAGSLIPASESAPPAETPSLVDPPAGLCAAFSDAQALPRIFTAAAVRGGHEARLVPAPGDVAAPVDWVDVPAGRGAVVQAGDGAVCLVTDSGRRHPVAGDGALAILGYGGVTPTKLPAALLSLLPAGAALDPLAARSPA